jgi:ABC-type uncharacterized transport system permease subunit
MSLVMSGLTAGLAGAWKPPGQWASSTLASRRATAMPPSSWPTWGACIAMGIVLAGLLMALLYLGGEAAQVSMQLPVGISWLFQGMLLFFLLGVDVFVDYRLKPRRRRD